MRFTEVIKVEDGEFCNLSAHLARLRATVWHFFGCGIDLSAIRQEAIPQHLRQGVVKCRVVYGRCVESVDFQIYTYRTIRTLALVECDTIDYSYKFERRDQLNALYEQRGEADEVLIIRDGLVTDTSFSNVVLRGRDGGLVTPSSYLLAGTERQLLLDQGVIREARVRVEDLRGYSEVYLINAMRNGVPAGRSAAGFPAGGVF